MQPESESFLFCRAGRLVCALPIAHVVEIMRPRPVDALAGTPPFVSGVSVVRGAPIPVVNVGCLLDQTGEPSMPGRFVTVRLGSRHAALAFDAVLGVRAMHRSPAAPLPPLLRDAGAGVVSAIHALDSELLVVLESARAVPSAAFTQIDARVGT